MSGCFRSFRAGAFVSARRIYFPLLLMVAALAMCAAQTPAAPSAGPNSDPTYQALRNVGLSGEAVSVNNVELKRDAGIFHLRSGTICFVAPVNSKVTGAVFSGDGNFVLDPPNTIKRRAETSGDGVEPTEFRRA